MHEALLPPQHQRLPPIHHLPPRQPPPQSHQLPQFLPLRQTSTDEQVLDYGLYLIQQHLARENINLHDIAPDMPQVMGEWHTIQDHHNIFIQRQLEFDANNLQTILDSAIHHFNPGQQAAFDAITHAYQNPTQASSCSSSMDQVELGRPLFTIPSLPRPDYRAILSFVLQAQALHPNSFSMDQLPTPCSRSPSHVMKSPPVVSRSRVLWLHYSVQQG